MKLQKIKSQVRDDGLSLKELTSTSDGAIMYESHHISFDRLRRAYLDNHHQKNHTRVNIYIEGLPSITEPLAVLLAHELCGNWHKEYDTYIYDVPYRGWTRYDGQDVVLFKQFTGKSLLQRFGSLDDVKYFFDPYYTQSKTAPNTNRFNIVTGTQPYHNFLTELGNGREDEYNSIARRFPIIICAHKSDCEVFVSRHFFAEDGDFSYVGWFTMTYANLDRMFQTDRFHPEIDIPFRLCGNIRELIDICSDISPGYSANVKTYMAQSLSNVMPNTSKFN